MWWIRVYNNVTKETGTYLYETYDKFLLGRQKAMSMDNISVRTFGHTGY